MFTPPPSPFPSPSDGDYFSQPSSSTSSTYTASSSSCAVLSPPPKFEREPRSPTLLPPPSPSRLRLKRRIGVRTKWTAILSPVILILITLSTRYIAHPAALDILLGHGLPTDYSPSTAWRPHKRHPSPDPSPQDDAQTVSVPVVNPGSDASSLIVSQTSSPTPTSTETAATEVPTVPSTQPAALPTPFPQAWDSDVGQNYSSLSCFNFFNNMTNTEPFRRCRPLSLLMMNSGMFINAQSNLTLMNAIIWGTCNTELSAGQCDQNMDWFAAELQTACERDLADNNNLAVNALIGLQAYQLVRDAGCTVDPTTDAYCYVQAVQPGANPWDAYAYQLPLGLQMPNGTTPTCSACAKSLFGTYVGALNDDTERYENGLARTYDNAARQAGSRCGTDFATLSVAGNGAILVLPSRGILLVAAGLLLVPWSTMP